MDIATLSVDSLVGLWVIAVLIAIVRAWQSRLIPLTKKARDRYVMAWDRVEARFVYAPQEAVRDADGLVMSALRDRRHPTDYDPLPPPPQAAHRKLSLADSRARTP